MSTHLFISPNGKLYTKFENTNPINGLKTCYLPFGIEGVTFSFEFWHTN